LPLLFALLILFLLLPPLSEAEDFSGEAYLIGSSVADNGTSGALPSRMRTATQYLDFPADFGESKTFRLEMATLPAFSGLSENVNGAFAYALDSRTQVNVYGGMITTPDIPVLPLLKGTPEERLNDPSLRPVPCDNCQMLKDVVYLSNINFMRKYSGFFPRTDIGGRPIPLDFSAGLTTKYYFEELEGGDYIAQNLNLDAGACLTLHWGYNPVDQTSDRNIRIQVSGFELLPTSQKSVMSNVEVYESMTQRWHLSASWEEGIPDWNSTVSAGFTQKSEGGKWPGGGLEWDFRQMLYLRGGWDQDYFSAGASVAYRWVSVHYAFRHHELGNSLYQVSAQVEWP
jgi:hypothetical protein